MGDLVDLDKKRPAVGYARLRVDLAALMVRVDDETLLLFDALLRDALERRGSHVPEQIDVRRLKVRHRL